MPAATHETLTTHLEPPLFPKLSQFPKISPPLQVIGLYDFREG